MELDFSVGFLRNGISHERNSQWGNCHQEKFSMMKFSAGLKKILSEGNLQEKFATQEGFHHYQKVYFSNESMLRRFFQAESTARNLLGEFAARKEFYLG